MRPAILSPPPVRALSLGSRVLLTKSSRASPVMPSASAAQLRQRRCFGQRGLVVVAQEFQLLLAVVEDLEEEHPDQLLEALGVAVDAGVLAHDVLDGFDEVGDVGHGSGGLLIEVRFRVRGWRPGSSVLPPKSLTISTGCRRSVSGSTLRISSDSTLVMPASAYFSSRASSTARACSPYLAKTLRFLHLLGALPAGERRLVEGDVADQVEGVVVAADLLGELVEEDALGWPAPRGWPASGRRRSRR